MVAETHALWPTKHKSEKSRHLPDSTKYLQVFPDELKKGVYSNNVYINHTPEEVVFDFINVSSIAGSVVSRVLLNPSHAKRFVRALQENIEKYEETYGEIPFEIKPLKKWG